MSGRADEDHLFGLKGDGFQLGFLLWVGHQTDVDHVAQNIVIDLVCALIFDVDLHRRVQLEEAFHVRL